MVKGAPMLLRGALLGLALGAGSAAEQRQRRGGAFEVVWNSWYPTQCRQFGDNTTAALFRSFGIKTNAFGESSTSPTTSFNGDLIQLFCPSPMHPHPHHPPNRPPTPPNSRRGPLCGS